MKKIISLISFSFCLISTSFANETETLAFQYIEGDKIYSSNECYTIIKKLGEGAFGEVFAVNNSEGQKYALKSYKTHEDPWMALNLYTNAEREFHRGQLLNHPNIIKSVDFFLFESPTKYTSHNLVLQFVEGETLSATERGAISHDKAMDQAIKLCNALVYALTFDLMHLDLHSGNVMLNSDSEIMVIDLASFFSYDEFFRNFVEKSDPKEREKSQELIAAVHSLLDSTQNRSFESTRQDLKFDQILMRHPKLLEHLQEAKKVMKEYERQRYSLNRQMASLEDQVGTSNAYQNYRKYISRYYFDMITEMCITVIAKSEISRDERINLRAEIKKISWNYEEDIEEGSNPSIFQYLEELKTTLKTF